MFEKLKSVLKFWQKKPARIDSETQQKQVVANNLFDKYQQLSELDKQILFFSIGECGIIPSEAEEIFESDSAAIASSAKNLESLGLATFNQDAEKPEIVATPVGQSMLDSVIMKRDVDLINQTRNLISDKLYDEDLEIPY